MNEAIIIVLPTPGKNPLKPNSYRPISLLNAEVKLLACVLTTRFSGVVAGLVHSDQSGFILARSMPLNIRRLFLNAQIPVDNPGNRAIFSLDTAKAFDGVEWKYLWEVLRCFGLGHDFISWVQLLYTATMARVSINDSLSDPFPLFL